MPILDSKGNPLGTSNGPQGNIGYPFKPEEIDAFMSLVKAHGRRIEGAQHERLRETLKEAAERIEKVMRAR